MTRRRKNSRLWPTPSSAAAIQGQNEFDGKRGQTLVGAARGQLWPTPRSGKVTDEDEKSWCKRQAEGKVSTPPLSLAAKLWPTPRAEEAEHSGRTTDSNHPAIHLSVAARQGTLMPLPAATQGRARIAFPLAPNLVPLTKLSLFSGIGGDDLASEWNGIETICFVEKNEYCQQVLCRHWPNTLLIPDVRDCTVDSLASLIYTEAKNRGVDMPHKMKDYSGAVQMYEAGFSLADVADYFHITRQAMWKILLRRDVKMRPNLRYGEDNHFFRGGPLDDDHAQNVVEKAVKRGALVPQPCEKCGANGTMADGRSEVQAHHDDYNKPLEVRWLCQKHHHEWHSQHKPKAKEVMPKEADAPIVDIVSGGFP